VNRIAKASYRVLKDEGITSLMRYALAKLHRREFRILDSEEDSEGSEELQLRNLQVLEKGAPDRFPIPRLKLVKLVTGSTDLDFFLRSGKLGVENLNSILCKNGLDLSRFESILDFGCGCGRIVRHITTTGKLYGCDYNQEAITWAKNHLPIAQFCVNGLQPPTAYSDNKFDLIFAFSILTHMPEELGKLWMIEFRRLLRPRGFLILSLHGEGYLSEMTDEEKQRFRSDQFVVRSGHEMGTNRCSAFHPVKYIRDNLAQGFQILDFVARGATTCWRQDLLLLQKED
jgi:SAM-dependent methyltransferase